MCYELYCDDILTERIIIVRSVRPFSIYIVIFTFAQFPLPFDIRSSSGGEWLVNGSEINNSARYCHTEQKDGFHGSTKHPKTLFYLLIQEVALEVWRLCSENEFWWHFHRMMAFDIDRLCLELFVPSACIIISLCIIKCLFVKCLGLKTDLDDEDDVGWLLGKNVNNGNYPGYYLMMMM